MRKISLLFVILLTTFAAMAQQNPPLPIDPAVRKGTLENGLTYYIRHNKTPEKRADFYIAQKVGSMMEEDNQAGLAHFLEHMAFNGTTNYPKKTMLEYLQNNGIKFGVNINAYTGFDETVYFMTDIPTDNKNLVDSVLLVLYDWADGIALEEEELDNERGVIREEWRTRGGSQQRLWDQLLPKMYPDSKYANRMPIGSIDVINNFKPEEIRAYYEKWYRPDLQGIVVVGDVDVDAIEKQIVDKFSKIKLDPNRAERVYFPVPDNKEPIVALATDVEARNTQVLLFYKHDPLPDEIKNTQAGYIMSGLTQLASMMMNERLSEIAQKPNAPFTFGYAYDGDYFVAKTKDAWTVIAGSAEDKIEDALAAIVRETERVKKHGFTASEYERAKANLLKSVENSYNNRDKQKNSSYSQEYVNNFTDGEPIPGIEFEYNMLNMLAPNIPVEAINQVVQQLIGDENIVIAVTGPEKEGLVYPTEEKLLNVLKTVKAENIEAYVEKVSNEPLITTPPTPGTIVKEEKDANFDATVWTLSNGVKVVMKKTDFKDDEIRMTASSYGGTAQYAEKDPVNAKIMGQVITLGGVGNFSATDLPKVLAGKNANVNPQVSLTTQGFSGSSSIKDFETMLQLVYLYFTAPRSDKDAFDSFMQRMDVQLKNQEAEPMIAFTDAIINALYDNIPYTQRLKYEQLSEVNYERIMQMYKQLFNNPGSFVFTFVGNIDVEKMKPMILQYLGSMKGQHAENTFLKTPMNFRSGKQENIFQREMQNPKASVFKSYNGKMERTLKNELVMSIFDQILDIVYTEKVREDEGGTYGVHTQGGISRYPEGQTILQIIYDTDPAKMEHLNKIIANELEAIAKNGVRTEDFQKVKEYMVKKYSEDIKENSYWLSNLNEKYFYKEDSHTEYMNTLNAITQKDVQEFAQKLLSQGNNAVVVMMPKE